MPTLHERFIAKVDRTGDCWNWRAALDRQGYSKISVGGKPRAGHRVAYEMFVGEIPRDMCVCHRCDNPRCVNPAHLFIGTVGDNVRDMYSKNRANQRRCEKHPYAKLTLADANAIRAVVAAGQSQASQARAYGVSNNIVWRIVNHITYRGLT